MRRGEGLVVCGHCYRMCRHVGDGRFVALWHGLTCSWQGFLSWLRAANESGPAVASSPAPATEVGSDG